MHDQDWQTALNQWDGIHDAPGSQNRSRRFGIRVMKNRLLERYLTTAHWTLPGLWAIPLVSYLLYRSVIVEGRPPGSLVALYVAGTWAGLSPNTGCTVGCFIAPSGNGLSAPSNLF